MGDVIEFENMRLPLNLLLIRGLGLIDPWQWRLENSLNHGYCVDGLSAVPQLVASHRDGRLVVASILSAWNSGDVPEESAVKALLDAAIVRRSFERCGREVRHLETWILAFSSNTHIHHVEYGVEAGYYDVLLNRAQQVLKDRKLDSARSDEMSRLL